MSEIIEIKTISDLNTMMGQDKPLHPLVSVVDFSKMDFSKMHEGVKFTTGFYSIMLKNLCPGSLRYGRNYYDFQEGSLFFMGPNQVVSMENPKESQDVYGWGLFFHPDLFRGTSLSSKMKDYHFFSYSLFETLHLSDKEKQTLTDIVLNIEHEMNQNIDKHSRILIVSTIELLLNYCNRFYDRQFITRTETNKDVITEFEDLLKDYFNSEKAATLGIPSVKYCADKLNFSPNYLSDLLKKETGKNATEHIQYQMVELAKEKLLGTEESVGQIAFSLGFEYPQYFSKLFKKNTGMTPAAYRKVN